MKWYSEKEKHNPYGYFVCYDVLFMSHEQNAQPNHNKKIGNKTSERVEHFKCLETTLTN